jgi:hypothetical protein
MGYCMSQTDSHFVMTKRNAKDALKAIKALAGRETIHDGPNQSCAHFSWVDTEDFLNTNSFATAMRAWRWDVDEDDAGNILGIHFEGEKIGDENLLFEAIAPFVNSGCFIEMCGEDDYHWRWKFDNGGVREVPGHVVFEED